jgi:hypothetical protein
VLTQPPPTWTPGVEERKGDEPGKECQPAGEAISSKGDSRMDRLPETGSLMPKGQTL